MCQLTQKRSFSQQQAYPPESHRVHRKKLGVYLFLEAVSNTASITRVTSPSVRDG